MKHTNYTGWTNKSTTLESFYAAVEQFIETELRLDWDWQLTDTYLAATLDVPSRKLSKTVPVTPTGLSKLLIAILHRTNKDDLVTIGDNYSEGYRIKSYHRNNVCLHLDGGVDEAPYVLHLMNVRAAAVLRFGQEWRSIPLLTAPDALINAFMATLELQD